MFIEKLKIKNFKSFSDEVVMDLNSNSRISGEDINLNKFYKNGDIVIPRVVSITGANSMGKTSILDAIDSLKMLLQPLNIEFMNYDKYSKYDKDSYTKNLLVMAAFQKVNDQLDDPVTVNNYNIYNYDALYSTLKKALLENANLNLDISISDLKDLILLLGDSTKDRWYSNKHNKNLETKIECLFYDVKLNEEATLIVSDINNVLNIEIKSDSNKMKEKVKRLYSSIYYHNFEFETYSMNGNGLQQNFFFLISQSKILFKAKDNVETCEKLVKLLKCVDPNINQIVLNNDNNEANGVKFINLIDGTNVTIDQLSTGTKKFIKLLLPYVVMFNTCDSGIILVDEIDNFMHQDLVDFFKRIIYLSESSFQLFFTTHNYYVATNLMSNKQIFTIEEIEGEKQIRKTSKDLNPTKDPLRALNAHLIGSHPFQDDIFKAIQNIVDNVKK